MKTASSTPEVEKKQVAAEKKGPSRADIRHGLDPDAASIDLNPKSISIADLVAMKMPESAKGGIDAFQTSRVGPFEKSTYRVEAKITSIEHKKDGDYYMVVKDQSGKQAVVEVPDPSLCKGSPLEGKIAEARKTLEERYHPTDKPKIVNDPATLDGVGFYGFKGRPGSGGKGSTPRLMPGVGVSFGPPGKS